MKEKKYLNKTFVLNSPLKTFILLSIRKEGTEIKNITVDSFTFIPSEIIPQSWRDRQICVGVFNYDEHIYTKGVEVQLATYTNLIHVSDYKTGIYLCLVLDLNGKLVTSLSFGEKVYIIGKERQYICLKKWNEAKDAYIYTIYSIRYKSKWSIIIPKGHSHTLRTKIYDEPIEKTNGEIEIGKYILKKDGIIIALMPIIIYNRNV